MHYRTIIRMAKRPTKEPSLRELTQMVREGAKRFEAKHGIPQAKKIKFGKGLK